MTTLRGQDGMHYGNGVSIIEGEQTGKAGCVYLPAVEWGDRHGVCTNGESDQFSLDLNEHESLPPPPPSLDERFLRFVGWKP